MGIPFLSRPRKTVRANPFESGRSLLRWTVSLYLCIVVTLLIVLSMAIWARNHDLRQVRATLLDSEMDRLRSHAERTVHWIQNDLERFDGKMDGLRTEGGLGVRWDPSVRTDKSRLYGAIVDMNGKIEMHTDSRLEGERLGAVWYDRLVPEVNEGDVVATQAAALTGGPEAYDVRVPIFFRDKQIASYHTGLSHAWLEHELIEKQLPIKHLWNWILVGILASVVISSFSLFQISRRIAVLREAVKLSHGRRVAELGQLMAGMIHDIRNPLNAMRLNLHALTRFLSRCENLETDAADDQSTLDQVAIIHQTNREIERIEGLMRMLLSYGQPELFQPEDLDVRRELETTMSLLRPVLERSEVALLARFTEAPVFICMDPICFRQILVNLINNAKEATGKGGQIQVTVAATRENVEIQVADDGPGVPPADRERIFEPFYSTKETGTGLGLALVRRYTEDADGVVKCESNQPRGTSFRLRLPRKA
jgi:signal transduction histidine kinase